MSARLQIQVFGRRLRVLLERARAARAGPRTDYEGLWRAIEPLLEGRKVVGFDVFDTLLLRRIEPEAVKELVARRAAVLLAGRGVEVGWAELLEARRGLERALCLASQRDGLDDEFDYAEMLARWLEAAGAPAEARGELARALQAHEEEVELASHEVHPAVPAVLARLRARGVRLVFVSDFYLPLPSLRRFLRQASLDAFFERGYASSTERLRKASGRLFRRALADLGVAPGELLFVGDNVDSDVRRPADLGIGSLLLRDAGASRRRRRLRLLSSLARRDPSWRGALADEIVEGAVRRRRPPASPAYELGRAVAPAIVGFGEHVLERAEREGCGAVFFRAPGGLAFHRVARKLVVLGHAPARPLRRLSPSRSSSSGTGTPEARALLHADLRARGFFDHSRVLLVEFGGDGSAADDLVRSLRDVPGAPRVSAVFFALLESAAEDLCPKEGWLFDARRGDAPGKAARSGLALLEALVTAPRGSADAGRAGLREVRRAIADREREHLRARLLLPCACQTTDDWRPYLRDRLGRYGRLAARRDARAQRPRPYCRS